MGQHMGRGGGDIKSLKNALDSGKILCIFLGPPQQLRILRRKEELPHLAAQGESGHILLGRGHILVDNCGPGFYSVGHLIGNIVFHHGSGVGRYDNPEQQHPN